jgi:hypothetical protein
MVLLHLSTIFNRCATVSLLEQTYLLLGLKYMLVCVPEIRGSEGADMLCVSVCNSSPRT